MFTELGRKWIPWDPQKENLALTLDGTFMGWPPSAIGQKGFWYCFLMSAPGFQLEGRISNSAPGTAERTEVTREERSMIWAMLRFEERVTEAGRMAQCLRAPTSCNSHHTELPIPRAQHASRLLCTNRGWGEHIGKPLRLELQWNCSELKVPSQVSPWRS